MLLKLQHLRVLNHLFEDASFVHQVPHALGLAVQIEFCPGGALIGDQFGGALPQLVGLVWGQGLFEDDVAVFIQMGYGFFCRHLLSLAGNGSVGGRTGGGWPPGHRISKTLVP